MTTESEQLPVFPLNLVLLPGGVQSLQIFEPRYLDMVSRCLREDSGFVITLIREGDETHGIPDIYKTGVKVEIIDWGQGSNGLLNIVVKASCKVTIANPQVRPDQLMMADIELLETEDERKLPPEFASMSEMLGRILEELGPPYNNEVRLDDAAWVAGRLVEFLPLKLERKQALLELEDPLTRLFMLRDDMLNLEII